MKHIVLDENADECVLTPEELEKAENDLREKRLEKARRKRRKNDTMFSVISKTVMGIGLLGMVISMLLESGAMMTACIATVAVAGGISYLFFKDK